MLRFLAVGLLAALAGCGSTAPIQPGAGPHASAAGTPRVRPGAVSPGREAARAADCEAQNPSGLYLVRVGDHPGAAAFYAMAWSSRPPTPQAVSVACLLREGEARRQDASTDASGEDWPVRRLPERARPAPT